MKAVAYCRVSTDKQKDEGTVQIQIVEIDKYCLTNKIQLVETFKDEGVSGANEIENRMGLPDLFNFLELHKDIEAVIIYKLDRLARDLYLQEHIIKQLDKLNVQLVSTKEKDLESNDPMRKGFRQFMGLISEMEKSFITMRMTAGRNRKALQGGYAGGGVPLGYEIKDSQLVVSSVDSPTIKLVFKLKKRKMTLGQIARHLNENNIPSAKGGKWYSGTVKYILENRIYKGRYDYSSVQVVNPLLSIITS
ncbi:MAG: recombinase family protein [Melioribacteraceae bacterium]